MKRTIYVVLLLVLVTAGISQAQYNSPVVRKTVSFFADSVANVSIERNLFLSGIYMPRGKTVTLKFDVSPDGTNYYRMSDAGSDYSITVDSTKATYIPFPPIKFYTMKTLKILIGKDRTDTLNVILDLRNY